MGFLTRRRLLGWAALASAAAIVTACGGAEVPTAAPAKSEPKPTEAPKPAAEPTKPAAAAPATAPPAAATKPAAQAAAATAPAS
ncbi:MAG TPA: hypothetical protein VGL23_02180, partial [Chloroflexota bacterium]